jgi:hypothetical protein
MLALGIMECILAARAVYRAETWCVSGMVHTVWKLGRRGRISSGAMLGSHVASCAPLSGRYENESKLFGCGSREAFSISAIKTIDSIVLFSTSWRVRLYPRRACMMAIAQLMSREKSLWRLAA